MLGTSLVIKGYKPCKESIKSNNWNPELITPLANVKLTLGDLIPEEGSVLYDEDNFIRLAYRDDNVFSFSEIIFDKKTKSPAFVPRLIWAPKESFPEVIISFLKTESEAIAVGSISIRSPLCPTSAT